MIKKLSKHGNSLALVIDKPILDLLQIDDQTELQISTDGRALIIEPAVNAERRERFKNAVESTNARYGRALRRLAE